VIRAGCSGRFTIRKLQKISGVEIGTPGGMGLNCVQI